MSPSSSETAPAAAEQVEGTPRVLIAKTSLDGHWRGLQVIAKTFRDGGFEVILLGMVRADEIVAAALNEDPDLIGLSVGGRLPVVERILDALAEAGIDAPVVAGGTIPPAAVKRLAERSVATFPPGSSLEDIITTAHRLVAQYRRGENR
jgi:methylmalonyl-CoA mutase cobalamin-binding domain/chain